MQVYLVRAFETKEIAGVFWARNLDALWDIVDQMGDPFCFEYRPVNPRGGGIYTPTPIGRGQNPSNMDFDNEDIDWGTFSPDELLTEDIVEWDTGKKWRRFDPFDVGHGMLAQIKRNAA